MNVSSEALTRLHVCTVSPELSLLAHATSTESKRAGTFYSAAKPKNANAILLCSFMAALLAPIGTIGTFFTASINLSESCTLQVVLFL